MIHRVRVDFTNNKSLQIDLDDLLAPSTVHEILNALPFSVIIHQWGEELYTDPISVSAGNENSKSLVNVNDVAYWPPGKAICLFFGPTPIGKKGEIKPSSDVNVIGTISGKNTTFPQNTDGLKATFHLI